MTGLPGVPPTSGQGEPVVVVGGGQGGFQLAVSLREAGHEGPITIVGDEPRLPYQRPPLSKEYLSGAVTADGVTLRTEQFFASRDITLALGAPVVEIDRVRREVVLGSGERLGYAHLVLATGARPRPLHVPGSDLAGVVSLRSLADAEALRVSLDGVARVVVIGGGFVGMEVAAAATRHGHAVTVVEGLDRPMARVVTPEVSDHVSGAHRASGTTILLNSAVRALRGSGGRVTAVELDTGELLPADLVVTGIGVLPNVELAEAAGLRTGNGVVVDERLVTSDPRISALGDCANYPSVHASGRRIRLESVQNAVDQARFVASRLAGDGQGRYSAVPWFWTHQHGSKVQMAGIPVLDGSHVVHGDVSAGRFSVFRFDRSGCLVTVESVNRAPDHMAARRLLAGDRRPTETDLVAAGYDLKALVA
ncbi:MAG: FAD-dependent pyridine nucleotide-disulfide oxidoreductase [Modestobacter sp.]|jgi:3-phenylpropionate/trans-cinnamate dioxygenase ferredoxin reductase subunit|nr:FAD-dependent pyridine nucleotide-disulfide oxidoreductase [Modestobacter sp.]